MRTLSKIVFIFFLLSINLAAAAFMVNESAGYYRILYPTNIILIPWAAAALAEIFQHVMMILTGKSFLTWLFRMLAWVIFGLTVYAAAHNVLKPIEIAQEQKERQQKLESVLKQEIIDNRSDRGLFLDDGQKTNTAISVNERRRSSEELKSLLSQPPTHTVTGLSTSEIWQLFLLRIAIQLSALACAWKIGDMYRQKATKKKSSTIVKRWRVKGEKGFVGIAEFKNGMFLAAIKNERKSYKTFNGALGFFSGTKYAGKIPLEPTDIAI